MSEPYELGVAEIARLIDKRRLSPAELVESLLQRIDRLEPKVRAWEVVDAEGARKAAEAAVRALPAELRGVPFGIKDIVDVAGLPTSAGFEPYRRTPVAENAMVIDRLTEAGAIILGKTVTTQFATTDPPVTRNPWNRERTPGGSSSGSAAAVAARMVPAAIGTQTGGSVLRPASYCGVVGLKPTYGRVSRTGVVPLSGTLDHVGVMARNVIDAGLVLQAIAGSDKRDPGSARWQARDFLRALERSLIDKPQPPRLGIVQELIDRAQPEIQDHVTDVIGRLKAAGAQVWPVTLPAPVSEMLGAHRIIMVAELAAIHAANLAEYPNDYAPRIKASIEAGQLLPAVSYLQARRLREAYRDDFRGILRGLDCLILPTVSNVAPDPGTTGDASFQSIGSLIGFPTLTLPTGLSPDRLPIGTQLLAPPFQESTLIAAARWCEATIGLIGPPNDE